MRKSIVHGIANNLAHYSLSGPAVDAPERTLTERRAGLESILVSVLKGDSGLNEKYQTMNSASEKLSLMLASARISMFEIESVHSEFFFEGQRRTASRCVVTVHLKDGRNISGESPIRNVGS